MADNSNTQFQKNNLDKKNMGEMNNNARQSSPSFNLGNNHYKNNQINYINVPNNKNQIKKSNVKDKIKRGAENYGIPKAATERLLETETGREILDAASNSSTPEEGVKEVVKVMSKKTMMSSILPAVIVPFLLILLIIMVILGKDVISGIGSPDDIYLEVRQEISSIISNYRGKVNIDGNLILATLVAYNDNSQLDSESSNSKNIEYMKKQVNKLAAYQVITNESCDYDSSTIRKIASNDDWFDEANYNCVPGMEGITYTLSIDEGNYNDDNSGSSYYWNLIDEEFIFDYYNEYMLNKDENTSENEEKISKIVRDIYAYYKTLDNIDYGVRTLCSNGITLDGVTMNFENYVKGVVYSYAENKDFPMESLKALAISARSRALFASNNCTKELHSVTSNLDYKDGYEQNSMVVEAVKKTSGQYLTLNGNVFDASYSNFPDLSGSCNVNCDSSYCSAELSYGNTNILGTHTLTIPRTLNGIDIANDGIGNCVGMIEEGMIYDANNGLTYKEILEKYYSGTVEIKISGGEGLVDDGNGFLKRVERAQRDNLYFYSDIDDYYNGYITGGYEGECAWYAVKRTNEIIATMGLQDMYNYVYSGGNGRDFCYANDYKQFEKSTDPNDPNLKPGALISWYDSSYGHVAVVEGVYRDSNGNITSIDISHSGIGFGQYGRNARSIINKSSNSTLKRKENCEGNNTGCQNFRNISISNIKNLNGRQKFICYIKIVK